MIRLNAKQLSKMVDGNLVIIGDEFKSDFNVCADEIIIDSRKVTDHSLFIPFNGEKVDAHKFIPDVMQTCHITFTEEKKSEILKKSGASELPDGYYIEVKSSISALQMLGKAIRSEYKKKVIGVTGSVGKTTTREMITTALSSSMNVFSTEGNNNSQIGVPLTLSSILDNPSDVSVIEMGISEPGGMDKLTNMVRPDIAVVTMIGVAHIEFMKTREGIRQEKMRIINRMDKNGVVFLNGDDDLLRELKGTLPVQTFYFGTDDFSDYRAENFKIIRGFQEFDYAHGSDRIHVRLSQPGRHSAIDMLSALAVADYFGLDIKMAADKFTEFKGLRQKIEKRNEGYVVIDDSYNASPVSMNASLDLLNDFDSPGRRYAVLGDMFELGENSPEYHKEVGRHIRDIDNNIDEVILLGKESNLIGQEIVDKDIKVLHFNTNKEAVIYLKENIKSGDMILIKASNGMNFNEIANSI